VTEPYGICVTPLRDQPEGFEFSKKYTIFGQAQILSLFNHPFYCIIEKIEVYMHFDIDFEQEEDGRWIAEITEIPGVLAYGVTPLQAGEKAKALALRVLAERMENEVSIPGINYIEFANHYGQMAIN